MTLISNSISLFDLEKDLEDVLVDLMDPSNSSNQDWRRSFSISSSLMRRDVVPVREAVGELTLE